MEENGIILIMLLKRKEETMDKLYSSIEINKVLDNFKETVKYYIVKEDTYGFKVTKQESNDLVEGSLQLPYI